MRRHLMLALPFAISLIACGDDNTANCGPGTHEVGGQCVVDGDDTSVTPTDTNNDTGATTSPTDTGTTTTTTPDVTTDTSVTPDVSNECTAEEAGKGDLGAACTKSCECRQDLELECLNTPYFLDGFHFCTKVADGSLSSNDGHILLQFPSSCFGGTPQSNRPPIYQHECKSIDDCKALASAYDGCGTSNLPWHSAGGGNNTQCPYMNSNDDWVGTDLTARRVCIITSLVPFSNYEP